MWNLLTMFVTLHAPFCMFLKSFEFLEFVLLDEMTCVATLNSSQAQLKSQVSKTSETTVTRRYLALLVGEKIHWHVGEY